MTRLTGNSYAVNALTDKRAEIAGVILDLERQLRIRRSDLVHLDAALRLLDPTIKPHTIRAKQPMADRSGYFAMGEISQRCLEGVRTRARTVLVLMSLPSRRWLTRALTRATKPPHRFHAALHWALGRLQRDAPVETIRTGKGVWWKMRADSNAT